MRNHLWHAGSTTGPSTPRRSAALVVSGMLLASLAAATVAAPAAAAGPTCNGRPATITDNDGNDGDPAVGIIEGTSGPDVIVGTSGVDVINGNGSRDIICGFGGPDIIYGGRGNDRIFGGGGDDIIVGGGGKDTIFGYTGNDNIVGDFVGQSGGVRDVIKGGPGDDTIDGGGGPDVLKGNDGNDHIFGDRGGDTIDGGAKTDDCRQGPGTGPIRNCERADLKVWVIPPATGQPGSAPFKVKVKNRGPGATSYTLDLSESSGNVTCDPAWDDSTREQASLRPGGIRTIILEPDCESPRGPGAWVEVTASVDAQAHDPRRGNNEDSARVTIK